jgi:phage regulator Rha-like protein
MSPARKPLSPVDVPAPAVESIALSITELRGQRVLLDSDLAALYGVETKRLNEQVKRNALRFPTDFVFQLEAAEFDALRSQIATLKPGRGSHRKYLPYAFTEHGAIMAAMVLNSAQAVEVSVYVVRAFVRLRQSAAVNAEVAKRLDALEEQTERLQMQHENFSHNTRVQLRQVFETLKQLTQPAAPPDPPKRPIGFVPHEERPRAPKAPKAAKSATALKTKKA